MLLTHEWAKCFYLDGLYVRSLRAFRAFFHVKLNALTFCQGFAAWTSDGAEMYEYIRTIVLFKKTKTFSFVELFNRTSCGFPQNLQTNNCQVVKEITRL